MPSRILIRQNSDLPSCSTKTKAISSTSSQDNNFLTVPKSQPYRISRTQSSPSLQNLKPRNHSSSSTTDFNPTRSSQNKILPKREQKKYSRKPDHEPNRLSKQTSLSGLLKTHSRFWRFRIQEGTVTFVSYGSILKDGSLKERAEQVQRHQCAADARSFIQRLTDIKLKAGYIDCGTYTQTRCMLLYIALNQYSISFFHNKKLSKLSIYDVLNASFGIKVHESDEVHLSYQSGLYLTFFFSVSLNLHMSCEKKRQQEKFHEGEHVQWRMYKGAGGITEGYAERKLTSDTKITENFTAKATPANPKYLVKSEKTGKEVFINTFHNLLGLTTELGSNLTLRISKVERSKTNFNEALKEIKLLTTPSGEHNKVANFSPQYDKFFDCSQTFFSKKNSSTLTQTASGFISHPTLYQPKLPLNSQKMSKLSYTTFTAQPDIHAEASIGSNDLMKDVILRIITWSLLMAVMLESMVLLYLQKSFLSGVVWASGLIGVSWFSVYDKKQREIARKFFQ
ncbi:hypothetical protein G9A89_010235 [Geosiphon pyriformis]|nr:hypothetical protein G9A89_010235 [Geosiphon pyriformis]